MGSYHKRHRQKPGKNVLKSPVTVQSGRVGHTLPAAVVSSRPEPGRQVSLEPLAPIVIRSGRPFDGQAGVDPARLPPPSTIAGALRTAWARANNQRFSRALLELAVAGPLLRRQGADGSAATVLLPRPADALYFGHGDEARCIRAEPTPFVDGCGSDLPEGLLPVQLTESIRGKPGSGPAWWSLDDWLAFRRDGVVRGGVRGLSERGWSPDSVERRTHVAINARGAAEEGKLFQTEGIDYGTRLDHENGWLQGWRDGVSLLARFAEPLPAGVVHLGGERRLAALRPESDDPWPKPPAGWFEQIARAGGLSLTLVTPGLFADGYRPGWLGGAPPGIPFVPLRLVGAAVDRWQPHSGWDLDRRQPRPTRRAIPAGAVYWCRLEGEPDAKLLESLWFASLCDEEQDRRDGFGLALPAPWTPPHSH